MQNQKYYKTRSIPYALKDAIECELDKLVSQRIFRPVNHPKWSTPTMPVVKKGSSIRICGDYKMTVNKVANCDKYPVPTSEDLLATLNGGQKFTKLDLQVYQRFLLDQNYSDYLTTNMHKGLFRPTRLQFGVHSAAGIFQREMESRLSHIPFTIVRMDDILISGKNSFEYKQNLVVVLKARYTQQYSKSIQNYSVF